MQITGDIWRYVWVSLHPSISRMISGHAAHTPTNKNCILVHLWKKLSSNAPSINFFLWHPPTSTFPPPALEFFMFFCSAHRPPFSFKFLSLLLSFVFSKYFYGVLNNMKCVTWDFYRFVRIIQTRERERGPWQLTAPDEFIKCRHIRISRIQRQQQSLIAKYLPKEQSSSARRKRSDKMYEGKHREARLLPMLTKRLHYRLRLPSLDVMMRKKLNSGFHFISCRHLNHHICSVCRWLFFYCLTFAALLTFSERGIVRMLWAISFHRMTSHAITTDSMRHAHDHTSIMNDMKIYIERKKINSEVQWEFECRDGVVLWRRCSTTFMFV